MILTSEIISVTEFRKNPLQVADQKEVCILKNNQAAFYTISPDRMAELLAAENKLKSGAQVGLNLGVL